MVSGQNKTINILILSNSHPYKTAGVVALDLFNELKDIKGNEVKLLVNAYDNFKDKDIISMQKKPLYFLNNIKVFKKKVQRKLLKICLLNNRLSKTDNKYIVQDYDQTKQYYSTDKILKKVDFNPDVVIVLFMTQFLNYKNLYEINKLTGAKILLYPMDMAPFTGGCHYAWECKGYTKQCGYCPAYKSEIQNDQSRINWLFNDKYIRKTNIEILAGTTWLENQIKQSSLFSQKKIHKILLPINEKVFKPSDATVARNYFKLPLNKKIIFFGATSIMDKRKGVFYLLKALIILKDKVGFKNSGEVHLAIAGRRISEIKKSFPFINTYLGHLSHNELAQAFQAADVFVNVSIEDSGPMMINQSIMCGTPVVAFEMGVAIDLVITGETGYRAKLKDSNDLANGIKQILELDGTEYKKMSENCRELGLKLCHPKIQAEKFIKIINGNLG